MRNISTIYKLHIVFIAIFIICIITNISDVYARIGSIPNAAVNEDIWRLNFRSSYNLDDKNPRLNHRLRNRIGIDYGLNDWYGLMLMLQWLDLDGKKNELSHIFLDQRFELLATNEKFELFGEQQQGYYGGFRLRYEERLLDNQVNHTHIRLIAGKQIGAWDLRYNQILGIELGAQREAGLIIDTRFQFNYKYTPKHFFGIETFHQFGNVTRGITNFGEPNHLVGAVFTGEASKGIGYEAGYMAGVSRYAPDHSFFVGFFKDF
jgi:hypothetical protein